MAIGCLSEAETLINPFHTARTPTLITTTAVQPLGTAGYKSSADFNIQNEYDTLPPSPPSPLPMMIQIEHSFRSRPGDDEAEFKTSGS